MASSPDFQPEKSSLEKNPALDGTSPDASQLEDTTQKSRWERSWPTIACGAGLFSDGYLNGVCLFVFWSFLYLSDMGRP